MMGIKTRTLCMLSKLYQLSYFSISCNGILKIFFLGGGARMNAGFVHANHVLKKLKTQPYTAVLFLYL